jgi:cyanophycinase
LALPVVIAMRLAISGPLVFLLASAVGSVVAQPSATHGPAHGALVLQGGVGENRAIISAFVALAGGRASHIVVIPTASVFDAGPPGMATSLARRMEQSFGVEAVTVLHTLDRVTSDSDGFIEPLRKASGVWLLGGMPDRLVQAYVNTKTERAIKQLLDRGGVVGGESAGAMIQGSWLDTTDTESFTPAIQALIRAHETGAGFGLLTHSAIFPHFDKRGTEAAVRESAAHPDQLAIGIDEEAALVVHGDRGEVVGLGTVTIYDGTAHGASAVILKSGDKYDLSARRRQ